MKSATSADPEHRAFETLPKLMIKAVMAAISALVTSPLLELWVLVAHLVLPASNVDGYVRDSKGKPLRYRL